MQHLELPGWRIGYDKMATQAAHAAVPFGGTEGCTCDPCRNWVRTRAVLLPSGFVALLEMLGIPPNRDVEVVHYCRLEAGRHLYGGWYHFIGAVEFGEQEASPFIEFGPFRVFFHSRPALLRDTFRGLAVVELDFKAEVPWLSEITESD